MPDTPVVEASRSTFLSIPIDQVKPSSHQARKDFDEEAIKVLAESMKQEGLIEPIVVRPVSSCELRVTSSDSSEADVNSKPETRNYELISGERRLRAAKLLGWTAIEAKIIQT